MNFDISEEPGIEDSTEPYVSDVEFARSKAYQLYEFGSYGTHPLRWERVRTEISFEDLVAEFEGERRQVISCPFHGRDSKPSFHLYKGTNDAYCFGCLSEDEPIWTGSGLQRIGDVIPGDVVFDRYGEWQVVECVDTKKGSLIAVSLDNFRRDPLKLTPDHTCLYVTEEAAYKYLPYIQKNKHTKTGSVFWGSYKRVRKLRKRVSSVPITEGPAENMKMGDYLLFAVAPEQGRNFSSMTDEEVFKPNLKGPIVRRHHNLPVTMETTRLYGLYLAEGSVNPSKNPRAVRWTFCMDERFTLATFVQQVLSQVFSLSSTITNYPEKNTCEVICSNSSIARNLAHWFGKGAENKVIPAQALTWNKEYQASLIQGYMEGDGTSKGGAVTVSRYLAYSLYALAIQCGKLPSLGYALPYVDKKGLAHRESWNLYLRQRETLKGFYQEVNGVNYYWSRISSVVHLSDEATVVDISVSGSESFTTKLGAVHNCPEGSQYYDAIRFVSAKMGYTKEQSLRWLEKHYNLPPIADEAGPGEEIEEDIVVSLGFADLAGPYISHASRDIVNTKDVELAEDYIRIFFEAQKSGDDGDPLPLARVLGPAIIKTLLMHK